MPVGKEEEVEILLLFFRDNYAIILILKWSAANASSHRQPQSFFPSSEKRSSTSYPVFVADVCPRRDVFFYPKVPLKWFEIKLIPLQHFA